jgi:CubicO group peptidase (beta-lactamase class C family)
MLRTMVVFVALFMPVAAAAQAQADYEAQVDRVFAKWSSSTPGCAVGVSVNGTPALARAYGMADLEHAVPNTADTIFESGSVAKQFTAAAVLLLARDGKLSLDDQVRTYIPELPDYGMPLTIRHMLTHTSGLRDWGSVAAIGGWPRGTRTYTQAHVLDIVSRQRGLNFAPGTRYSYSNTGYNLAAILVSRVSGMSFADFTKRRIFEPLDMTRSSWRDDYARVVSDRAIAYAPHGDGFRQDMPFENAHGNGGMLTTVGDLLKWTTNFASPKVGDGAFVQQQTERGRFSDGRAHGYAMGLGLGSYKGVRMISHAGATAGYRAQLNLYPDRALAVAVVCNAASADASSHADAVADVYLGNNVRAVAGPSAKYTMTDADYAATLGLFRDTSTGRPYRVIREADAVRIERGPRLLPISSTQFVTGNGGSKWEVADGGTRVRVTDGDATAIALEKVSAVDPSPAQLQEFAGMYLSSEAEASMNVMVEDGALVIKQRPTATMKLAPAYADAFTTPALDVVIFRRDAAGRVTALSVVQDRVWDLRFGREDAPVR